MLKQFDRVSSGDHGDLGQRIGDHARGRAHGSPVDGLRWFAGAGIDDRRSSGVRRLKWIEASPRGRHRLIIELDTANKATRIARIADVYCLPLLSERGEIAAGIDHPAWHAEAAQHLQRAIRVALLAVS